MRFDSPAPRARSLVSGWIGVLDWLCLSGPSYSDKVDGLVLVEPSRFPSGVGGLWKFETNLNEKLTLRGVL